MTGLAVVAAWIQAGLLWCGPQNRSETVTKAWICSSCRRLSFRSRLTVWISTV